MPFAFFKAVEETVHETLRQGLYGWQVTDCTVTMTHSGYWARQSHAHATFDKSMSSTAGDFRNLTPLVLMGALAQAGTRVHEPMHRFRLEIPADTLGRGPARAGAAARRPGTTAVQGSSCLLEGEVPAARVHELQQQLPALTRGEGVLESAFDRYEPVRGPVPTRPGPTTTRSTARSTCCGSCGGSAGEAVSRPRRPRGPCTSRSSRRPGGAAWAGCSGGTWRRSAPAAWRWPPGGERVLDLDIFFFGESPPLIIDPFPLNLGARDGPDTECPEGPPTSGQDSIWSLPITDARSADVRGDRAARPLAGLRP